MSRDETAAAAALYDAGRGNGLDAPGLEALAGYDDVDLRAGLRLQLAVLDRWVADGAALGGWKVGLTSRAARNAMGEGFRPFGYLLADRMFGSGAGVTVSPAGLSVEPELALVLGSDIADPDVSPDDARAAVSHVAAAFEINQRRLPEGQPRAIRIGDDLTQWGSVVGDRVPVDDVDVSALHVRLLADGAEIDAATAGADTIDDPFVSLARVARLLAEFGRTLQAGQVVLTGSLLPPSQVSKAREWKAEFGGIGVVRAVFDGDGAETT